ncbi:MAG TPA: hypothetical protein V6D12_24895, partial [Candidatus Obscuribacterales bacterium]
FLCAFIRVWLFVKRSFPEPQTAGFGINSLGVACANCVSLNASALFGDEAYLAPIAFISFEVKLQCCPYQLSLLNEFRRAFPIQIFDLGGECDTQESDYSSGSF